MRSEGSGGRLQWSICAAIAAGRDTLPEIVRALSGRLGASMVPKAVTNLAQGGYLQLDDATYRLTDKGLDLLGPRASTAEHAVYRPPKAPPRRPGSEDFRSVPSLFAGRAVPCP